MSVFMGRGQREERGRGGLDEGGIMREVMGKEGEGVKCCTRQALKPHTHCPSFLHSYTYPSTRQQQQNWRRRKQQQKQAKEEGEEEKEEENYYCWCCSRRRWASCPPPSRSRVSIIAVPVCVCGFCEACMKA
jgi:hypothetical protein